MLCGLPRAVRSYLTEFGGEWVQAFPKDSWENITNAYEPFTFNDFGSKIPLQEFRPTTVTESARAHRYYSISTGMQIGHPPGCTNFGCANLAVPVLAVPIVAAPVHSRAFRILFSLFECFGH